MRRGIKLLPNLLTTANLFCGFFSITKTLSGDYVFAAWIVVLAGFFDFADGRVARLTKTQSDFGVEYDSLSDLTTFCMAPALLAYTWSLSGFRKIGLAAAFLFFACGALRLARFNVQVNTVEKDGFQGLPSPAAAGTVVSYVIFCNHVWGPETQWPVFLLGMVVMLGLLMVSNVKYRSFKRLNRRASFFFLVCTVAIAFVVLIEPEVTLFVLGVVFVSVGVVEWVWKSPQRIRGFQDLLQRFFAERRGILLYDDEQEPEAEAVAGLGKIVKIPRNGVERETK